MDSCKRNVVLINFSAPSSDLAQSLYTPVLVLGLVTVKSAQLFCVAYVRVGNRHVINKSGGVNLKRHFKLHRS